MQILRQKNLKINTKGKYSLNNLEYLKFNLESNYKNNFLQLNVNFDYTNSINLNLINYKKQKDTNANLSLEIVKEKDLVRYKKTQL